MANFEKNVFAFLGAIIAGATLIGVLGKPAGITALGSALIGGTNEAARTLIRG